MVPTPSQKTWSQAAWSSKLLRSTRRPSWRSGARCSRWEGRWKYGRLPPPMTRRRVDLADYRSVEDLFRRESGHLVAALTRVFGPSNLTLVEDVVQDALMAAMQAWRFGPPRDPKAWILQTAKNRAIDV